MVPIALALVSALMLAVGAVFEQQRAAERPGNEALRPALIWRLVRDPRWLLGLGLAYLSFPLQAVALHLGRLVVIQPLLSMGLALVVPLGWVISRRPIRALEAGAAVVVAVGLAGFLALGRPAGGKEDAPFMQWALAGAVAIALAAVMLAIGLRFQRSARGAAFGVAGGITFGVVAALVKGTVSQFGDGVFAVVFDWHLYALVTMGAISFLIEQSAYQTGALGPSVAATKAIDPVAAVILGVVLLDERFDAGGLRLVAAFVSLAIALAAIALLGTTEARPAQEADRATATRPARAAAASR